VPVPLPTHFPTNPTPVPTPSPTPVSEIAIAPEELTLTANKPSFGVGLAYIVNLNNELLEGSVALRRSSLPNGAAWSVRPDNFTLAPGEFTKVEFEVGSTGLVPQHYNLTFEVAAKSANSLPIRRDVPIDFTVAAKADPDMTQVVVEGAPTIDVPWDGVKIYARDADGLPLSSSNEDFGVGLIGMGNVTAKCKVGWFSYYKGECTLPDTSVAGTWRLSVTLNNAVLFTTDVHAKCQRFEYEDLNHRCLSCASGVNCDSDGNTLETLQLLDGMWRISPISKRVRECPMGTHACRGGINTTSYCRLGYEGILCDICSTGYFMHSGHCKTCDREHSDVLLRVFLVIFLFVVCVLVVNNGRFIALWEYIWSSLRVRSCLSSVLEA